MKNSQENFKFENLSAIEIKTAPFSSEAIFLFGSGTNSNEIYIRRLENSTEYLKLRQTKFDIFAIKNRVIGLLKTHQKLENKVQVGEAKFDHTTIYTMITFSH